MMTLLRNMAMALLFAIAPALSVAEPADPNPDTLRVALLPDEDAATIIKQNQPLKAFLEQKLGKTVELVVTTDYSSMVEAMRFGRLELGYFGPLSYTMAKSKADISAFAARLKKGSTTYHSVLIGNKAQGITSLDKVTGGDVAYGDIASTSSHLIPKKMLLDGGLTWDADYREHFVGAHDAVALAVQNGNAQAGGLSQPIFELLVERGVISLDKVVVLGVSPAFPQYPWAIRNSLAPELQEAIKQAFYAIDQKDVLKAFKVDGFAPIDDGSFDVVRELATDLGLFKY